MNHFADRLLAAVNDCGNPVCVGLDPRFDLLPQALKDKAVEIHGHTPKAIAHAFLEFNRAILEALSGIVRVCKPQIAFYEELGAEGIRCYAETIALAQQKGFLVISDAKRGDIGTTAVAYARAHLGGKAITGGVTLGFDADALTVNPYMGHDTITPYLEICATNGKGIFVLVKTSNAGSGDIQDLDAGGKPVYEYVAEMVNKLGDAHRGANGYSSVGAVVAATYPEQARRLRELLPRALFLVPGYGAQGATAEDCMASFNADGQGAVVNASRSIIFAFKQEPYASTLGELGFADAARAAAVKMAEELKSAHRHH